jgi:hypothetical protein
MRHLALILRFEAKINFYAENISALYSMRSFDISEKFKIDDRSAYT